MEKLLFITSYNGMWPFIQNLSEELSKRKIDVDILDYGELEFINFNTNKREKVFSSLLVFLLSIPKLKIIIRKIFYNFYFRKFLNRLNNKYEVVSVLYHSHFLNNFTKELRKTGKRLVISYAGSDFYRINDEIKNQNKTLLKIADTITFNNEQMKNDFIRFYKDFEEKIKVTGFGLSIIAVIDNLKKTETKNESKLKLNIPEDSFIITIGYNANTAQQHSKAINSIIRIKSKLPINYLIIFPFTYNHNKLNYNIELTQILNINGINHKFFNCKLSDMDIARLRIITDITINLQVSDQASAALLEHLYAKNILIVGNWLPYDFWDKLELHSYRIEEEKLDDTISNCIANIDVEKKNCEKNAEFISAEWSWEKRILIWLSVFNANK